MKPLGRDEPCFCPRCGKPALRFIDDKQLECTACGFTYFHNTAAAVAVIIEWQGELLLAERAHEPALGKLDLPGGFVDPGETVEQTARREIREELGIEMAELDYVGCAANTYAYRDVTYESSDVFFHAALSEKPELVMSDEHAQLIWLRPEAIQPDRLAFDSIRQGLDQFAEWTARRASNA